VFGNGHSRAGQGIASEFCVSDGFSRGIPIDMHLRDWLYGFTLPGKWFAFKIMAALVACTPHIHRRVGEPPNHDQLSGISLSYSSYWHVRSVLGRVLGCLPGVTSVGGWIGPWYPIQFRFAVHDKTCYIYLAARSVLPLRDLMLPKEVGASYNPLAKAGCNLRDSTGRDAFVAPEEPEHDTGTYVARFVQFTMTAAASAQSGTLNSKPDSPASSSRISNNKPAQEYLATITFSRGANILGPIPRGKSLHNIYPPLQPHLHQPTSLQPQLRQQKGSSRSVETSTGTLSQERLVHRQAP
jgi:hypothetical protein